MIIRKAEERDFNEVVSLHRQLDDFHTKNVPKYFKCIETEFRKELFLSRLNSEDGFYLIVQIDEKVVGFANCAILEVKDNPYRINKKFLKIEDIIVDEKYRRKNIATKLFQFLEDYARNHDLDYLELGVVEFNEARLFYEKSGFRTFMRIMRKDLK